VTVVQLEGSAIERALRGTNPRAMGELLASEKATGLAVLPTREKRYGVLGELSRLAHVPGLRAVVLAPEFAVFAPFREPQLSQQESDALAYVARALFRGAREPQLASFPDSLRRVERVEVMVTLSQRGQPRLWRSARGTSIARTLLTATRVARDRWREREQAMGGPLAKRLLELDVEVSLLSEDGTLVDGKRAFVDQAITAQHGLGFDYRNDWHYLSPADVQKRGKGSAFAALSQLLSDYGLGPGTLSDPDLRLYRFVPLMLGVSKAPLAGSAVSAD
jgi:hypothetical protein